MNPENVKKIVDFGSYCPHCQYWETNDTDEPCNSCLNEPSNTASHKPVKYEKVSKKKKRR